MLACVGDRTDRQSWDGLSDSETRPAPYPSPRAGEG